MKIIELFVPAVANMDFVSPTVLHDNAYNNPLLKNTINNYLMLTIFKKKFNFITNCILSKLHNVRGTYIYTIML